MANDSLNNNPNKCHASVKNTNHIEEPKNLSTYFPFLITILFLLSNFHLFFQLYIFIQKNSFLNFSLASSERSQIALEMPLIIAKKMLNMINTVMIIFEFYRSKS